MIKRKVTVLGRAQARPGYSFKINATPQSCLKCEYLSACLGNIEVDRIYLVKKVLDKELPCILRGEKGILCEVEEAEIILLIKAEAAVLGASFTYEPARCPVNCQSYNLCHPPGLRSKDRCSITEVFEFTDCPERVKLASVKVRRLPQAS